jgi:hypothetical protein
MDRTKAASGLFLSLTLEKVLNGNVANRSPRLGKDATIRDPSSGS